MNLVKLTLWPTVTQESKVRWQKIMNSVFQSVITSSYPIWITGSVWVASKGDSLFISVQKAMASGLSKKIQPFKKINLSYTKALMFSYL